MADLTTGAGAGAAGGIFGAFLHWLGVRDKFNEIKEEINKLDEKMVWRPTCSATHKAVDENLAMINKKLDTIVNKLIKKED